MALSNSILSYEDVRTIMDNALNAERGVRITCTSRGAAIYLRQRCNKFRQLDRRANAERYEEGEPMHNRSVYDELILRVHDTVLELEKGSMMDIKMEEI